MIHLHQRIASDPETIPARETFHLRRHPHLKDSVTVQTSPDHDYVNDCETHEENPHLQDFLKPHHIHTEHQSEPSDDDDDPSHKVLMINDYQKVARGKIQCHHEETPILSEAKRRQILPRPCEGIMHYKNSATSEQSKVMEAKRTIKFKDVTLREYGMILGDHPNCKTGVPVTLDWEYLEYEPLSVDEYEIHHALRRPLKHLWLPIEERFSMLKAVGYTERDFRNAMKNLSTARRQRRRTKETLPLRCFDAGIETVVRRLKRNFLGEEC